MVESNNLSSPTTFPLYFPKYCQKQSVTVVQNNNCNRICNRILDTFGNVVAVAVAKLDVEKVYEDFRVIPENTNFGIKGSVVKTLLQAHNVPLKAPNKEEISKSKLSQNTTKGTLRLSSWMTVAQIQKMQSQKAMFDKFD